ncbi:MAG TPA: ATP-binding protein [Gemmataceae bacterium]|nr:ATP-binding protein [Gemmataceae bacterium]
MKILVAEDEKVSRCLLESVLTEWGHEVVAVGDGLAAWQVLKGPEPPPLAVLDWEMPGMVGPEVCRKVRALLVAPPPYLLLLTAKEGKDNIAAGLRAGANDYLSKPFDADELRARLDVGMSLLELKNLEATSRELERRVQERTAELAEAHADNERLLAAISSVLIGLDDGGRVRKWNKAATDLFSLPASHALGQPFVGVPIPWEDRSITEQVLSCAREDRPIRLKNVAFARPGRCRGYLDLCVTPVPCGAGAPPGTLILGEDRTEQRLLEAQLAQAHKLESIGQLAAGIAHEINTPIQYVGDNTVFLRDSFAEYRRSLDALRGLFARANGGPLGAPEVAEAEAVLAGAELDYLSDEVPKALEQTLDGIRRVARIVRSMKEFSHPGGEEKTAADLNRLVENTITVARHEWKYVAEVVTDFDPSLSPVPCLIGEFNQVVLNLLVNAAHAVGDRVNDGPAVRKGTITVSTRRQGDWAEVRIRDTGTGIPEEIRSRVFDPFFTTKPVGKGTGQGLAIAHAVIVKKHGGELTFETELGEGTTFLIRLPLTPRARAEGEDGGRRGVA